jgi:D-alanyl-D-alanine carboxypeptidase/D-alanyl-D-alanine-endopeptidase (penicillin-binding protein 4)
MKKIIIILIPLFCCLKSSIAQTTGVGKKILHEINRVDPTINIGIKIRNLKTGKIIYQQNENRYYTFASCLKFISLITLQHYFGNDHQFISKILKKGDNYYLDINDPDFSTNDLDFLIKSVKKNSALRIKGNFYIINTNFSLPPIIGGRMVDDGVYCLGSPITKVHINKNCIRLAAHAGARTKDKINLKVENLIPYKIVNNAVTIPNGYHDRITTSIENNRFIINGTLNNLTGNITISSAVNDNLAHIKLTLAKLLKKNSIILDGKILYSSKPKISKEIATSYKTFQQLANQALKISDNYITEYLLAEFSDIYAKRDWREAGSLLKQLVYQTFKVDLNNAVVVDGSGLSRYNLFTVNQFDNFLTAVYNKNNWQDTLSILPTYNKTSSLGNRFKVIKVFAKSGSMSGVSSLVGYMFDQDNTPHSFVIVANNYIAKKKKYAELEEGIIRVALAKGKRQ